LAPEEEGIVDELTATVAVDGMEGEDEVPPGIFQRFFDPFVSFVFQRVMDRPPGSHIGHGQSEAKFPCGIAAVVLDEVNLEEPGRLEGTFTVGEYGDPLFQRRPGFRPAGSPDFQSFLVFDQQPFHRGSADAPEFSLTSGSIG
jgi:hypothetical protein